MIEAAHSARKDSGAPLGTLDDILARLDAMPPEQRAQVERDALAATQHLPWTPNPGPQTEAYLSEADELFYGGEAGPGKTDLGIGLSLTAHKRSLFLRRTNSEARKVVERYAQILGTRDGWNGQEGSWRLPNRLIDIGGCQLEDDKQKRKGDPHDLIVFDELPDFTETQYTFITGWNRSSDPEQRCRIVAAGNPPTRPEGLWVVKRWAPWLDPHHPRPAKSGELRWFTTIGGKDTEVDGPGPHIIDGESKPVMAKSRTFIRAHLSDNPDLAATDYDARLAALPEELRKAYREGRFDVGLQDAPWQVIPSDWIRAAVARWRPVQPVGVPMCALGVDVAQGGSAKTIIARRYDGWYPDLISVPGSETPDGSAVAGRVTAARRDRAMVIIDVGGGWGAEAFGRLRENDIEAVAYMGVKPSTARTADNQLRFFNMRSEVIWRFREALNPDQPGGSPIMLPDDPELIADLAAPTYQVIAHGIRVIAKETLVEDLGRSPDKGDAVVMAWYAGARMASDYQNWQKRRPLGRPPEVILGHSAARRKR